MNDNKIILKEKLIQEYKKCNESFKKIFPLLCIFLFVFCAYMDKKIEGDMFFFEKTFGLSLFLSAIGYLIIYFLLLNL